MGIEVDAMRADGRGDRRGMGASATAPINGTPRLESIGALPAPNGAGIGAPLARPTGACRGATPVAAAGPEAR